jgi:chromosomal replication initiation ATPase DnaA
MHSYDTREVTKEIADWLNLEENKALFYLNELSKRIGLHKKGLMWITTGRTLTMNPIAVDKAVQLLSPFGFTSKFYKKDFDYVLNQTSIHFKTTKENITSKSREGELPKIRKYVMKIACDKLKLTQNVISDNLGGFNRSSIAAGVKTLNGWIERDRTIRNEYSELLKRINISK